MINDRKNTYSISKSILDRIIKINFDGDNTEYLRVVFINVFTYITSNIEHIKITYNDIKNIKTFKRLIKFYTELIIKDTSQAKPLLDQHRTALNDFNAITEDEKNAIENEINNLDLRQLSDLAYLDNDYLLERDGKKYNQLQPQEVYKLSYSGFLWVKRMETNRLKECVEYANITFNNPSNNKKADRLTETFIKEISDFIKNDGETYKTPIDKPITENIKSDPLFMMESHGTKTDKLTSDFQLAIYELTESSPLYYDIIKRDTQIKPLLSELGDLERANRNLNETSEEYKENKIKIDLIKQQIANLSENYIYYRNKYFSIDSEDYKTSLNVELEGFYNFMNKDGENIAILPPRILAHDSKDYKRVYESIIDKCLMDAPTTIYSHLILTNNDIYKMMGVEMSKPKYDFLTPTEKKKCDRAKETFINIAVYELENTIFNNNLYKGRFMTTHPIGDNYRNGIEINIDRKYLNIVFNESVGNYYNKKCYNLNNKNAVSMYIEIARNIFTNRNKDTPNDYAYKFSYSQLRKYGKYNSESIINANNTDSMTAKNKNKAIRRQLLTDLKTLYDNHLILISAIKNANEFTIYILNDNLNFIEQYEYFKKIVESNGHSLGE